MRFANPEFLILLVVLAVPVLRYLRRQGRVGGTMRFSNVGVVKTVGRTRTVMFRHGLFVLRMAALALLIVAFARPQAGQTEEEIITEGVDIMLALDISSSMQAEDFKPKNRLEAAKVVVKDFIAGRQNDRIGMVVFAGKSFTQCPLTLDYGILLSLLKEVKIGLIEDGTAIGMALANAANRLRDSKAKSKVVILLTDGRNNKGQLDPVTAARVAQALGIKVYTVGTGKRGYALYPVNDPIFGKRYVRMAVEIDEEVLTQIAEITGGQYFRATDPKSLEDVFRQIDDMEKTKIEVKEYTRYQELFVNLLLSALVLILIEIALANTVFRKIP